MKYYYVALVVTVKVELGDVVWTGQLAASCLKRTRVAESEKKLQIVLWLFVAFIFVHLYIYIYTYAHYYYIIILFK